MNTNMHKSIDELKALVAKGTITQVSMNTILGVRAKKDTRSGVRAAAWLKANKGTTAAKVATPKARKARKVAKVTNTAWADAAKAHGAGTTACWNAYKATRKAERASA